MWIYDNSNLNESYSGIVSPATSSFARRVYRQVYIQFCRLAGVPDHIISQNDKVFSHMVTAIGGRMYYTLNHWHRMIRLLPGYRLNSQFLEEMMGIDPSLRGQVSPPPPAPQSIWTPDTLRAIFISVKMLVIFLFMGQLINHFLRMFDRKSKQISRQIHQAFTQNLPVEKILAKYHVWEADLTRDFSIPIANDFAVMISVGLLRRLAGESAAARLTSGLPGVKSAEPGKQFLAILTAISQNKALTRTLLKLSPPKAYHYILTDPRAREAKKLLADYIHRFGIRVPGELKLESLSFQTDPVRLISLIQSHLVHPPGVTANRPAHSGRPQPAGWLVRLVARWAQVSITRREETRFQRAVAFGLVRDILQGLGRQLKQSGQLDQIADIFYLTIDDLDNYPRIKNSFRRLVRTRRREETAFSTLNLPSRLVSPTPEVDLTQFATVSTASKTPRLLWGTVACAGLSRQVRGEAVVMPEFDATREVAGKILVTAQTDPGWTIIFPLLKGLVVERGGVLSHASIVSREFGLPCIVGAAGAASTIKNGLRINMDMGTGKIWQPS